VALPAFAAARRVEAQLLLTAAVQQSVDISWLQQTRSSGVLQANGTDGQTDGRPTVA